MLISIGACAIGELYYHRYKNLRCIMLLLVSAVVENLGYRQLNSTWRILAFVDFFKGDIRWGSMERNGFKFLTLFDRRRNKMNKLDFKEVLDRNFLGDWDLFKTVTEAFCDTVADQLDALKTAIASKENKRIKETAHKLKGSIAHFHHVDPVTTVKSIEEQWQNPNYPEIEAAFVRLNGEISTLMVELKVICSQKSFN
ncbi:hypothetical protein AZI85_17045 [Bdellovibrio bacteriovorus]|uniref:HPt domain-containing protein n=1 Tax=Bdellovibrio bacteriovorus TaxID=959 RepID=A0A150WSX1_BDEBC|nr:Hpt domain-containing protein [Bdellovibrio bacteriovorus]KYG67588.1 hypothetical protein AZI85_17045 [Bdellovibrio bacteriovorus]